MIVWNGYPPDPDDADRLRVLSYFGPVLRRCVGGRLVASGYVCPHCDSGSPSTKCNAPREAKRKEPPA